jgi:hypothetical protein
VRSGRLVLKGGEEVGSRRKKDKHDKKKKKHKKSKSSKSSKKRSRDDDEAEDGSGGGGGGEPADLVRRRGTGTLLTSSTTVQGSGTKFMSEVAVGDAILVVHPTSLVEEVRLVRMVLSDISISLSSPLSTDLITGTGFEILKQPRDVAKEQADAARSERVKRERLAPKEAFGTYAGGAGVFTYRTKKGGSNSSGGYKIVTEQIDGDMTRDQLLDLRSKKKSDRMCM